MFISVNALTYLGTVALSNFGAVIQRFSELYDQTDKPPVVVDENKPKGIKITNGSFGWKRDGEPNLTNINLEVRPGELAIVIGNVGCGKTTLLHSIMRENFHLGGELEVNGTMAYVEQEPFIYSATITENIIMGRPYDRKRLEYAIKVSQLEKDLKMMGNGTNTVIGERGINISGGQKARISLARAIFSNVDIYLFDDPLSAVDPEVANNLYH